MMFLDDKKCLNCQKPIQGRSDKKFCDDFCRSHYNNHLKSGKYQMVRKINNALKKNRRILAMALSDVKETMRISREQLLLKGFQFKYHTHRYVNKRGDVYIYCYDYGYLQLDSDWFLVVKIKEAG
ncbi:hypothetical protein [Echinicola vietnamensis]|uniref:DUF2116 family Zn-ribbon domain-containing protein n=1 Tax=Echinicola vietnamensis (strain DSM 17526 / LMG 23754 / KMM 6221) TaxID=926556 RepID=L0G463_ECHVK|nr:hypothetical protein [Echinicola vietnamensis]AGA80088.1 hypothetical protein Echvi_3876 [Echinicola vietnamensis DSM 17526]